MPTDKQIKKAEQYIENGAVRVSDPKLVRKYCKRGENISVKTYNRLTEIIARTGALIIPFRNLPEVKKILQEDKSANTKTDRRETA